MPKQITNNLRVRQAELFKQSVASNTSPHFVYLARHLPYQAGDAVPPDVNLSLTGSLYDQYRNMICGKHVTGNDIAYLIRDIEWTSGKVYDFYDDTDADLFNKEFYVVVKRGTARDVFLCIGNNGRAISTVAPSLTATSAAEFAGYETRPDGYIWKYMFSVSQVEYNKFHTVGTIPVVPNADVSGNSVSGSIDYIALTKGGSDYGSYNSGLIQAISVDNDPLLFAIETTASSNAHYYDGCAVKIVEGKGQGQIRTIDTYYAVGAARRIKIDSAFDLTPNTSSRYEITPAVVLVGDGSGFTGRALVNAAAGNTISSIEITTHGESYTWATATVVGNTGGLSNTATIRPIVGPYTGHGSNPAIELGSNSICISTKFSSVDSGGKVRDVNDFRTVGVLRSPLFADVQLTLDATADFIEGDVVTQDTTGATGIVTVSTGTTVLRLTDVLGYFRSGYSVVGQTAPNANAVVSSVSGQETYFDQTSKLEFAIASGSFDQDEKVIQSGSPANAYIYTANSTVLNVTDIRGKFVNIGTAAPGANITIRGESSGVTAIAGAVTAGDLVVGSGEVLYIDNKSPVAKNDGQTETIKVILEF